MRLCVLIPSEDYRNFAGARIRYGRIREALTKQGWTLDLKEIGEFDPMHSDYDIHVISKCHDARAMICAHLLKASGKYVGVDLFDDYFSQRRDPRLARFRTWLTDLIRTVDFVMCSTPAMAAVARTYRQDFPVHVMNDPLDGIDGNDIRGPLERKLANAHANRCISIAWFGVGDNPHFPVGLSDLVAFGAEFHALGDSNWQYRFKVLTNERALTADRLSALRRLPVQLEISLWSEEAERSLLDESLLCFLPVNAQNFSMAKSLNRAVSALGAGCQVLSNGFPLYDRLEPLIYRDLATFVRDLQSGDLKLRHDTVPAYDRLMEELASEQEEAKALVSFLQPMVGVKKIEAVSDGAPIAVIHGVASTPAVHILAQKMGALSVGSPFSSGRFTFDVIFKLSRAGRLVMHVSKNALDKLHPSVRARMEPAEKMFGQPYWSADGKNGSAPESSAADSNPSIMISRHLSVLKDMRASLTKAFGSGPVILSEMSSLPLETTVAAVLE